MKSRFLLLPLALLLAATLTHAAPNVIFILADDAGYADFGFQGGAIGGDFADLTPRITSIATCTLTAAVTGFELPTAPGVPKRLHRFRPAR